MVETTSKKENIHPFIWIQGGTASILKDARGMGLREFDEGLEAYFKEEHYHQLPGAIAPMEIWECDNEYNRFLVVARYPSVTLVIRIQDAHGLRSFMEKYIPAVAILPEVMIEKQVPAPNNTVAIRRGML